MNANTFDTVLRYLNAVARSLRPLRLLIWLLLGASIGGFVAMVFGLFQLPEGYAMVFLVGCLWSLSLLVVLSCFPRVPAQILSEDSFAVRVSKHIQRGFTWLMAVVTVLVNIAVLMTTVKLGGIFVGGLDN